MLGLDSLVSKIVSSEDLFMGNFKDSLRKLFIHEVSYIKNIEYDFNGIIGDLESYEPDKKALESWLENMKPKRGHYQGIFNSDS